jgi:hypothetical protein
MTSLITQRPWVAAHLGPSPRYPQQVVQTSAQKPKDTEDQALAIMKRRVREVGLQGYADEQKAISKLTNILQLLKKDAEGDVRERIEGYLTHFETSLPETPKQMLDFIRDDIASIPQTAPDHLKKRMEEVFDTILRMQALPDDMIAQLSGKGGMAA